MFGWWLLMVLAGVVHGNSFERNRTISRRLKTQGALPTIFIVGAQKAGSSSLFELMIGHPFLLKGIHKETHFFDGDREYAHGEEYYSSTYFPLRKSGDNPKERFIDGTPMLHKTYVWERIKETLEPFVQLSSLRFIAILREPVARDLSWHMHNTREQLFLGAPFSSVKTLKEKAADVLTLPADKRDEDQEDVFEKTFRGQYVDQLEAFTKTFRRSQLFITSTSLLVSNTTGIMERLRKFMLLPSDPAFEEPLPHDDHIKAFRAAGGEEMVSCIVKHVPQLDCDFRDSLAAYYAPYNQRLYQWMKDTKADASPHEPTFKPFEAVGATVPCVVDARAAFDDVLAGRVKVQTPTGAPAKGSGQLRPTGAGAVSSSDSGSGNGSGSGSDRLSAKPTKKPTKKPSVAPSSDAAKTKETKGDATEAVEAADGPRHRSLRTVDQVGPPERPPSSHIQAHQPSFQAVDGPRHRSLHTYGKERERVGSPSDAAAGCPRTSSATLSAQQSRRGER